MSEFKYLDTKGNEVNVDIKSEDFAFLQDDQRIYDEKFQTKTTTFAKDALKRFCRNKSSVVAAFIIGILILCSIFVPVFSKHDVSGKTTYPYQALLQPKLFKAGTGFWDGTDNYSNQVYDIVREDLASDTFKKDFRYNEKLSEILYTDKAINGAHYGVLAVAQSGNAFDGDSAKYTNYHFIDLNINTPVTFTIDFNDQDIYSDYVHAKYKLVVQSYDSSDPSKAAVLNTYYIDQDWSSDYGVREIDLSKEVLTKNNLTELKNVRVGVEFAFSASTPTYVAFDSINLSTNSENATEEYKNQLATLSINDANVQVLLNKNDDGTYPAALWSLSKGERRVYQAQYKLASFDFDKYGQQFGTRRVELTSNEVKTYVDNGWLKINTKINPDDDSSFDKNGKFIGDIDYEVLNEKCPIIESTESVPGIVSVSRISIGDEYILAYNANVTYYKYVGYDSMPSFILGTTEAGYDLFTLAFFSLRTSLSLAVLVSAINFTIGLIWGSISGYFGGSVDLIMQRITDILNGMPFIVVVTLCILHLGNTILTFGIALCLTGWISTAARTRTQFYRFRGREYVLASRTLGASDTRLIFKHILPNALGTIVTGAVLMIPGVIFSEATLAYLNLGLQGTASFGVLLSDNQKYLSTLPVLIIFPAIIISLLMISFNLFGNGLRDALNPSLKGSD